MADSEEQEVEAESAAILDYRDAWACRFLAMATQTQIEDVGRAMQEKLLAFVDSRIATIH